MLSAVITALLFFLMLLIVASFVFGALRERKRHLQSQALQERSLIQCKAPGQQVTAVLQIQNGSVVGLEKSHSPFHLSLPTSWYRRRRTIVSFGLLLMVVITLFAQSGLVDGAIQGLERGIALLDVTQHTSAFDLSTSTIPLDATASSRIVRVDSADRRQYYKDYQWQVWLWSS